MIVTPPHIRTAPGIALYYFVLLCCIAVASYSKAQMVSEHNLNLGNGLSSNNIYALQDDYLHYLWICTDNGLFRYNGYNLKKYSFAEGLPNNDVWYVTEDLKHRLWVHTIAGSMGYILNGKYHTINSDARIRYFYPKIIDVYSQGIFTFGDVAWKACAFVEANDTLKVTDFLLNSAIATGFGKIITLDSMISVLSVGREGDIRPERTMVNKIPRELRSVRGMLFGDYVGYYYTSRYTNILCAENIRTGELKQHVLKDKYGKPDTMNSHRAQGNRLYIQARANLYVLNKDFEIIEKISLSELTGKTQSYNDVIAHIHPIPFWGTLIPTRTHGLYFNYGPEKNFAPVPALDLYDYKYVGNIADSLTYWWHYNTRTLMQISETGRVQKQQVPFLDDILEIRAYDRHRALVINRDRMQWFYPAAFKVEKEILQMKDRDHHNISLYMRTIAVKDPETIYIAGSSFSKGKIDGHELTQEVIDTGARYAHIVLDDLNGAWLYNNNRALYYVPGKKNFYVNEPLYQAYGITNIEQILPLPGTSSLFLKDNNNLYFIDPVKGRIRRCLSNYNLENALMAFHNGLIILAGKFGMIFAKVTDPEGSVVVYSNLKGTLYLRPTGMGVFRQRVMLNTEKGVYSVPIPPDSAFGRVQITLPVCKTIITYRDTLYNIADKAVLPVVAGADRIGVDVINPVGNGALQLSYFIEGADNSWQMLNGTEIKLPRFKPGRHYTLLVKAADNSWSFPPVSLKLYMVPLWWQLPGWKILFRLGLLLAICGLLVLVALITRHRVARAADRKQYTLMLELRSIYAQLNPHFIFNTLNTALYFIRKKQMNDAATHITTFSHLLRSYINVPRNRLITVRDEITNIRNYIQLQQNRFDHVFSYEIVTNDLVFEHPAYIPSLLVQPIVENAINHGLLPRGADGLLIVSFYGNADGSIRCTIDDNGIGREESQRIRHQENMDRDSRGSILIRELVDAFNKYEQMGIEITYTDKVLPLTGTVVTILIKHPYDKQPLQVRNY